MEGPSKFQCYFSPKYTNQTKHPLWKKKLTLAGQNDPEVGGKNTTGDIEELFFLKNIEPW